jgi:hypothetical protein
MAIGLANIRSILLAALRKSPEQRVREAKESQREIAKRGAEEAAKYHAMSDAERREYDDLTFGMMPRLRGAKEYWRARDGGSRTGCDD